MLAAEELSLGYRVSCLGLGYIVFSSDLGCKG